MLFIKILDLIKTLCVKLGNLCCGKGKKGRDKVLQGAKNEKESENGNNMNKDNLVLDEESNKTRGRNSSAGVSSHLQKRRKSTRWSPGAKKSKKSKIRKNDQNTEKREILVDPRVVYHREPLYARFLDSPDEIDLTENLNPKLEILKKNLNRTVLKFDNRSIYKTMRQKNAEKRSLLPPESPNKKIDSEENSGSDELFSSESNFYEARSKLRSPSRKLRSSKSGKNRLEGKSRHIGDSRAVFLKKKKRNLLQVPDKKCSILLKRGSKRSVSRSKKSGKSGKKVKHKISIFD